MTTIARTQSVATIDAQIENLKTMRQFCSDPTVRATITKRLNTLEARKIKVMQAVIARTQAATPRASKSDHNARVQAVAAPVQSTALSYAERRAQMVGKDATIGQMKRINRAYKAQGLREYRSLETFRLHFDMATASDEFYAMTDRPRGAFQRA